MSKSHVFTCCILFIFLVLLLSSCTINVKASELVYNDSIPESVIGDMDTLFIDTEEDIRKQVTQVYMSQLGVMEATGKNDGYSVELYLASVGLGKGYAWCAAFVKWVFDQVGVSTKITAWSPTAHNSKNIVYNKKKWYKEAQPADVFTIYYPSKGRIGHTGFVHEMRNNDSIVVTVEGNTDGAGSSEGDGVYMKFRPILTIHSITSWIP